MADPLPKFNFNAPIEAAARFRLPALYCGFGGGLSMFATGTMQSFAKQTGDVHSFNICGISLLVVTFLFYAVCEFLERLGFAMKDTTRQAVRSVGRARKESDENKDPLPAGAYAAVPPVAIIAVPAAPGAKKGGRRKGNAAPPPEGGAS